MVSPSTEAFGFAEAFSLRAQVEALGAQLVWATDRIRGKDAAKLPTELQQLIRSVIGEGLPDEVRFASRPYRVLRAMVRAPSLAVREVLCLPVAHWAAVWKASLPPEQRGLPLASTLHFVASPFGGAKDDRVFIATLSELSFQSANERGIPVFLGKELIAAAQAADLGRARPQDLHHWLDQKQRGRWILDAERSGAKGMPGYREDAAPTVCFGDLLDALAAELVGVDVHEPKGAP